MQILLIITKVLWANSLNWQRYSFFFFFFIPTLSASKVPQSAAQRGFRLTYHKFTQAYQVIQ